jgi:hypothetical protein
MKLFVSWSGPISQQIAQELRDWFPLILPSVQPFITTTDLEKGAQWQSKISRELEQSNYGIVCLTPDNLKSTWLAFEAGALSKQLESRVATVLFGLKQSEVSAPLNMFQSTLFNQLDMYQLIKSINDAVKDRPRENKELETLYPLLWPRLNEPIERIINSPNPTAVAPPEVDVPKMIAEMMALLRQQTELLSSPDKLLSPILQRLNRSEKLVALGRRTATSELLGDWLIGQAVKPIGSGDLFERPKLGETWEGIARQLGAFNTNTADFIDTPKEEKK